MSSIIILLWIVVPAALFLTIALYVVSIGYRTRSVDLRGEVPTPEEPGRGPLLLTIRGLDESCDTISGQRGEDR